MKRGLVSIKTALHMAYKCLLECVTNEFIPENSYLVFKNFMKSRMITRPLSSKLYGLVANIIFEQKSISAQFSPIIKSSNKRPKPLNVGFFGLNVCVKNFIEFISLLIRHFSII